MRKFPRLTGAEGREAPRDATSSLSAPRFDTRNVSSRSASLAAIFGAGRAFREALARGASPSAVLPAGERILAGRCPAPSRSAAANRARRRRPFPAFTTPHECALERKRRGECIRAGRSGDKFFRTSAKRIGRKAKSRKAKNAYPHGLCHGRAGGHPVTISECAGFLDSGSRASRMTSQKSF